MIVVNTYFCLVVLILEYHNPSEASILCVDIILLFSGTYDTKEIISSCHSPVSCHFGILLHCGKYHYNILLCEVSD